VKDHLYVVSKHNWRAFAEAVIEAAAHRNEPVSAWFFEQYSFNTHLPKLVNQINRTR
jgi:hypothetical protein